MDDKDLVKKVMDLAKKAETYNPLENEINFKNGFLKWKIKPKVNLKNKSYGDLEKLVKQFGEDLEDTDFHFEFNKDLVKDEINLTVKVDGTATFFKSGINEDNLKLNMKIEGKKDLNGNAVLKWHVENVSHFSGLDDLKNTKFDLELKDKIEKHDIEFSFGVNGDVAKFVSPKGSNQFMTINLGFTKKY